MKSLKMTWILTEVGEKFEMGERRASVDTQFPTIS